MIRFAVICAVVFVPVMAYAANSESSGANLILSAASLAVQVYLASKIPAMDKRLSKVETELSDFIEGVVR